MSAEDRDLRQEERAARAAYQMRKREKKYRSNRRQRRRSLSTWTKYHKRDCESS